MLFTVSPGHGWGLKHLPQVSECEIYLLFGTDGAVGSPVRLCRTSGKVTSVTSDPSIDLMSVFSSRSYLWFNFFIANPMYNCSFFCWLFSICVHLKCVGNSLHQFWDRA